MILNTITDSSYFYQWLQGSDNYKNSFSYEGANALQAYLDELSDDIGEYIEFDPIAWCCEFTEYESLDDFNNNAGYIENVDLDGLKDSTTVIELDNGGLVIQDY